MSQIQAQHQMSLAGQIHAAGQASQKIAAADGDRQAREAATRAKRRESMSRSMEAYYAAAAAVVLKHVQAKPGMTRTKLSLMSGYARESMTRILQILLDAGTVTKDTVGGFEVYFPTDEEQGDGE